LNPINGATAIIQSLRGGGSWPALRYSLPTGEPADCAAKSSRPFRTPSSHQPNLLRGFLAAATARDRL
jgi:hypothetical protein